MNRHSNNKLGACICVLFIICSSLPAAFGQQHTNRFFREKTDSLCGNYTVSFRTSEKSYRYVLSIDSVQGASFYGTLSADTTVYKKLRDFVHVKGMIAGNADYDFIMKPVFKKGMPYRLDCQPADWLFNNTVYFSRMTEHRLAGRMVVRNERYDSYVFSFYGLKRPDEAPPRFLAAQRK
ncbi:hypothetical protein [uncultured Chitinophaga sp.]|uniref:hypothetical protein n=1 Tax=uncultured Chitinophaga sp. TaxID=339340 RepID=UPI0025D84749|nr:hypothetical protein [uncultured Chitinophaga sp.]